MKKGQFDPIEMFMWIIPLVIIMALGCLLLFAFIKEKDDKQFCQEVCVSRSSNYYQSNSDGCFCQEISGKIEQVTYSSKPRSPIVVPFIIPMH